MNHVMLVSEIEGAHQLEGELAHDRGRNPVLFKPDAEGPQVFSHKLQHEADVVTVGARNLEIIDEVADIFVAHQSTVSCAKMSENLPLVNGVILAVAVGTQDFESPKSVLVIRPACCSPC